MANDEFEDRAEENFWSNSESISSAYELNENSSGSSPRVYDLEERTARFGEAIIRFSKKIPRGPGNDRLIGQLVGAGTSVGANYCEADDAVSKKEFRNKIGTCRKEARETKFFLRMIATAEENLKSEARAMVRSEGASSHLLRDFTKMNTATRILSFGFGASTFFSHSSLLIRHFHP